MTERRFRGRSASAGLAIGPLVRIDRPEGPQALRRKAPLEEEEKLRAAMAKAGTDLEALADVATGDGADILAFQIEMLTDPALIEDVLVEIGTGRAVLDAWNDGIEEQIQGYQAADDDYFRARASDLEDLKDRVSRALLGVAEAMPDLPEGAILLDRDLTPSRFLALDHAKLGGVALLAGSVNSHVAMLARARGAPMVVAVGAEDEGVDPLDPHDVEAILDGEQGVLILRPSAATRKDYAGRQARRQEQESAAALAGRQPAVTRDGQPVEVLINVDDPAAVDDDILAAADGVGLLRTEFLFLGRSDLPDEDEQFRTYSTLVDRLAGRQVIVRTLDIGGDKPLPGVQLAEEANPFLGLRGIRLCLENEALFRVQVRALLRASVGRNMKIMLPMVTIQAEIDRTREIFATCLTELKNEATDAAMPPIGIMVETPAAAIAVDRLDADFYSIGSNDLIQYVMAAARDAVGPVADLLDPGHPAIRRLIAQVVAHGGQAGKEVSLCGDMASDPAWIELLLRLGLRKLSVAPAALGRVKHEIGGIDLGA